ncbi:MAG: hypothetical protein K0S08_834 [Gammaproteobacteria bacterium]|jgi:asparagine synthase (glutamine-hydrolysing)|nr:hypothetical protein [Gammaproteobacteria bacterium]
MCGIIGVYSKQGKLIEKTRFVSALQTLSHRGPDAQQVVEIPPVSFGHARLNIIDLTPSANQPFFSNSKNSMIIFNGEIYNYQAIKKNLISRGYTFHTTSDTEVLVTLYEADGIEATLKQLNGMFAFAIFDFKKQVLYLARDHLGIKPLYYYNSQDFFSFSSEPRALIGLHPESKELDLEALSSYFSCRHPLNGSFFKKIRQLSPGNYLEIQGRKIQEFSYWNLEKYFIEKETSETILIEQLDQLLQDSVNLQKHADVKVGAFLSGGVDSSLITAYAAKSSDSSLQTYTAGFAEEGFNEFSYARQVAELFPNIEHHELMLSCQDYFEHMQHLILIKGAPLAVPNEVPLYLMSRALKEKVGVVLSGEGADELFGGYGRIFRSSHDLYRRLNLEKFSWSYQERENFLHKFSEKYPTLNTLTPIEHFWSLYSYTTFADKQKMLHPDINLVDIEANLKQQVNQVLMELPTADYPTQMMYAFIKLHLPGLLGRLDAASMAASLEARVPFLDHRIVEFAAQIPHALKLKWLNPSHASSTLLSHEISEVYDVPKYILKKTAERYLPNDVLYRKKMGFPLPIGQWLSKDYQQNVRDILLSPEARARGIYNMPFLEKALAHGNTWKGNPISLWMLMNIELFCQRYFNGV